MKYALLIIGMTCLLLPFQESQAGIPKTQDGYYQTGSGIRHKKILLVDVKVYEATHEMKAIPNPPTRQNLIQADVEKRTTITLLRNVKIDQILEGIREGYAMNGFTDEEVLNRFLAPLNQDLEEGATFRIKYDPKTQTTWLLTHGGRSSIPGREFMMATWATWFQNHERPELTEALMKHLASAR